MSGGKRRSAVSAVTDGMRAGVLGIGVYVRPDGITYEGEWLAGKQHGHGTLWSRGEDGKQKKLYTGGWKNGKRQVRL